MTKAELTTLIMANTDNNKKSHLAKMHIADLENLAAPYMMDTEPRNTLHMIAGIAAYTRTSDSAEILSVGPIAPTLADAVAAVYDEHVKMVKGPRIDKAEFREVAIEKAAAQLHPEDMPATIREVTLSTMEKLLHNKTLFCPINHKERRMLATIPLLDDFTGIDSIMNGKEFLIKVRSIHNMEPSTTRALMVALCRKGFYSIKGVKSGQNHTTIQLRERGIRYLINEGLLTKKGL